MMQRRQQDEPINTYVVPPATNETVRAGWWIPLLQALTGGVLIAVPAGILMHLAWPTLSPWLTAVLVGFVFAFYAWMAYRGRWAWRLERLLNVDLTGDGVIGRPDPAPPLRIELVQEEGKHISFIDLPHADKIPALADGLVNGQRTFAMTTWVGAGNLLSRKEWEDIREALLARGLAVWKNAEAHEQGVELTAAGRVIFRQLADRSPTGRLQVRK